MNGPSAHLSWRELGCHNGESYPLKWRASRAVTLATAFEQVRSAIGHKPIVVLSAYRTESYNAKVGGAKFSQHKEGRALDLRPPVGMTVTEFYRVVRGLANEPTSKIRGLGLYRTFLHMDVRPSDRVVVWAGSRAAAEVIK